MQVSQEMPNMRVANFQMGFEKQTNYNTTTDFNNAHF
jgi:hypothetical protein